MSKSLSKIGINDGNGNAVEGKLNKDAIVVGAQAFRNCVKLKKITLYNVYAIGEKAFDGCTALESADLRNLRNTGASAFQSCASLKTVQMNEHTKLSYAMFAGSGLESVTLYEKTELPNYLFANCYELDCSGLKILDLNSSDFCVLHWLTVLLENREFDIPSALAFDAKEYLLANFAVDYSSVDAIIVYRADDSYFSFAQDFINGTISYRQLNNAMLLGKLGNQFVLKSREAFDRIHFIGYEPAESRLWYAKKMFRDQTARREYFDIEKNRRQKGDIYITQIMDEEMKSDDTRLR